ncbi:phosphatidate cytidylyltransferase [Micromonospora inositola]|uniref:Phosphatidate cytidylyltransferase n=1 Tax=Micromonospora inositola TaxID=47865 RepID=A0A1C5GSP9_9ACTN|nr:phosphatidate cytidylyltransferase [Micromonospora inositola]SCG36809.1 phosphatidate cytidylyltransferase [Micromonospora inositola]
MSHPDPYGAAEPRGWDRPDRPPALPWPDPDLEPGPWRRPGANPELYAEPPGRPRPTADSYPGPAGDPYVRPDGGGRRPGPYDERPVPANGRPDRRHDGPGHPRRDHHDVGRRGPEHDDRGYRDHGGYRDDFADGRRRSGGFVDPGHRDAGYDDPRRSAAPDRGYPGNGPRGERPGAPDDEYPTAQIAPVRDEPDPEPEQPSGRRPRGRRRASADRPPTQQAATGRAGRNLPAAIAVGVGLGAAILVPLFLYPPAFLGVVVAAVAVGTWEMARAVRRGGAHPPLVPLVAGGAITVGLGWFAGPDALSLGLLVTVLGTMIWRLGDGPGNYQRDLTAATLIAVYVPFLGGFAAMLAAAPGDGRLRVLATLVAVVLSDTGGYAAGVSFGKHPMAPSISPKKSWEGFAGSVTAAAAGSALLIWLLFDVAPWWGALFGVAISCAAVLGDLAESMIKRDLGVKDMSNLLPGHGGLMDRLDSILFAVPTAYLLLAVFVPVVG